MFTTLFFDLDGTLYSAATGLWEAISHRMDQYMHLKVGLRAEEVPRLRRLYYETYGTTLRGLQTHHAVDSDEYLAYVHDIPLDQYLESDPVLHDLLISLPQDRWIFTNADERHARRVLKTLQIEDCFTGIIDVRAMDYLSKPDPISYRLALKIAGQPDPRQCALFDDTPHNLTAARQMGFFTVLIGPNHQTHPADQRLSNLHEMPSVLPELWDNSHNSSGITLN